MITEKLYYKDAYIKEFNATVLSCLMCGDKYEIILDKSAFFPEEGGQSADTGFIDGSAVVAVKERDGVIYHTALSPVEVGKTVLCRLDFDIRFEKMQIHTAEHILSGLFHSEYGIENVGFHLGDTEVTMDTSAPITEQIADRIEALANSVVYANKQVSAEIYSPDDAKGKKYRAKLEFTSDVRLVEIEGVDLCACCAPHVASTGEIGLIKILKLESHKGGTRIYMLAGARAYRYISEIYKTLTKVSAMLSAPPLSADSELSKLLEAKLRTERELSCIKESYAVSIAKSQPYTDKNLVCYFDFADRAELRSAVKAMKERTDGIAVALGKSDKGYSFVMLGDGDISPLVKKATAALMGKGGGRGAMAEGSFGASLEEITSLLLEL